MMFKVILICSTIAAVYGHGAESYVNNHLYSHGGHHDEHHGHHAHPKYNYEYGVKDPHTGDIKSQHEERDGDKVKGFYSFHEADGTIRVVHYTSDKHTGFQAHVERRGHADHPGHHHH